MTNEQQQSPKFHLDKLKKHLYNTIWGIKQLLTLHQDQVATLLGFHGAMNMMYLLKMWRLFKMAKTPNYDHLRWAIKGKMIRWADRQQCWIEEGVYFDNKSLDEWIALKFNLGNSTALYSSAKKGISILKCCAPTSAHLKELH
jgi:hypothetical protein